jgi:hypothetical protein
MTSLTKVIVALLTLLVIGVISGVMYEVTVFLFAFSGGQARMEPVVNYAAIVVTALVILLAAVVWKIRSPTGAAIFSVIATPAAWVGAILVEWGFSQFVFVTGAP